MPEYEQVRYCEVLGQKAIPYFGVYGKSSVINVFKDLSINGFIPLDYSEESSSRLRTLNSLDSTSQKKLMK